MINLEHPITSCTLTLLDDYYGPRPQDSRWTVPGTADIEADTIVFSFDFPARDKRYLHLFNANGANNVGITISVMIDGDTSLTVCNFDIIDKEELIKGVLSYDFGLVDIPRVASMVGIRNSNDLLLRGTLTFKRAKNLTILYRVHIAVPLAFYREWAIRTEGVVNLQTKVIKLI